MSRRQSKTNVPHVMPHTATRTCGEGAVARLPVPGQSSEIPCSPRIVSSARTPIGVAMSAWRSETASAPNAIRCHPLRLRHQGVVRASESVST
eukprot:scaffold37750_cov33-Tisochrysis_lutea.AAC.1